ncbi:MAG: 3-methyl-2-oxobutanoate hydroxymethyltransferase [Deltaproteobacteria bacterium]|nr:3-methyl-2-oxobutanoate hydroxymethyltransferase [Deltaproteobacteria bacterium]
MKKITVPDIVKMKSEGRKIPVLTAYDYPMARILDDAGIPILMVGDSCGMVEAGRENTLTVTLDEIIYHTRSVARGRTAAVVVSDMPFGSYQTSVIEARRNAARLVAEGGAEAVKIEGGRRSLRAIKAVIEMDIPVMGHIGLTPQSVHAMGGYRVQGKSSEAAEKITEDARELEKAGVFAIVLEGIPSQLAGDITAELGIPTIGIGAGPNCDGQVLVLNDMLGLDSTVKTPKYVKRYMDLKNIISSAVVEYVIDVEAGRFPSKEQSY